MDGVGEESFEEGEKEGIEKESEMQMGGSDRG